MNKIYKISQTVNDGYDTYDSAVVCAENEKEAKHICPSRYYVAGENDHWFFQYTDGTQKDEGELPSYFSWCRVADVRVEYLGEADSSLKKGVIVASFNAG